MTRVGAADRGRIRRALWRRREELLARHGLLERDRRRQREALEGDWHEAAIQKENDEVLDALDEAAIAELREIGHALDRLRRDSYGRCVTCGGTIDAERLRRLPETPWCSACAGARGRARTD